MNDHALNDFRAGNAALTDDLLTDNVAALAAAGAISLERVAQDGMRVRAHAGAASFRHQAGVQEHLGQARELVQARKTQAQSDPGPSQSARAGGQAAHYARAPRAQRPGARATARGSCGQATQRRQAGSLEHHRRRRARVMQMGDAGLRPAYNVQFATDCEGQVSSSAWRCSTRAALWRSLPPCSSRGRAATGPQA